MGLDHNEDDFGKQDLFETVASLVERLTVGGKGQELRELSHDDDSYFDDKKGHEHIEKPRFRHDGEHSNEADGFKIVDEIESLCMRCHENVRSLQNPTMMNHVLADPLVGNDPTFLDKDSLLSRDCSYVILL